MDVFELMFSGTARKELEKVNLNFADLIVVIQEAVALIAGDGNGRGER